MNMPRVVQVAGPPESTFRTDGSATRLSVFAACQGYELRHSAAGDHTDDGIRDTGRGAIAAFGRYAGTGGGSGIATGRAMFAAA